MNRLLTFAGLVALASCAARSPTLGPPQLVASEEAPVLSPVTPNPAVPEAVREDAGAITCTVGLPATLGGARERTSIASAFGEAGGLVAWRAETAVVARAIAANGSLGESSWVLPFPAAAEPSAVVPIDGGFVVVARAGAYAAGLCLGSCRTGVGCQRLCQRRIGTTTYLAAAALSGEPRGAPLGPDLELRPVIAVTPAYAGRFALVTDSGQFAEVELDAAGRLTTHVRRVQMLSYLLPVRGAGRPTMLTFERDGTMLVIDARGEHAVDASVIGTWSDEWFERFQARHGADGRVHVAWWAPKYGPQSVQHAVVTTDTLRLVGPPRSAARGVDPPFAAYVFAAADEKGIVQRRVWPYGPLRSQLDLAATDPQLQPTPSIEWTGDRFVALYLAKAEGRTLLRTLPFDCGGE